MKWVNHLKKTVKEEKEFSECGTIAAQNNIKLQQQKGIEKIVYI